MTFRKSRIFTDGELEFMKVLWALGEATPEEIQKALEKKGRSLTYGTIRNVLVVMIEKGYVTRNKKGKVYLYRTKVNEIQWISNARDLVIGTSGSENTIASTLDSQTARTYHGSRSQW